MKFWLIFDRCQVAGAQNWELEKGMRWYDRSTTNGFLICDFYSKIKSWTLKTKILAVLGHFLQKNGWFFYWMIPLWYNFQTNVFVCTIYDFYWEMKTKLENIRYLAIFGLFFCKKMADFFYWMIPQWYNFPNGFTG